MPRSNLKMYSPKVREAISNVIPAKICPTRFCWSLTSSSLMSQSEIPAQRKLSAVLNFMVAAFGRMLFKESISKIHPSITMRLIPIAKMLALFT